MKLAEVLKICFLRKRADTPNNIHCRKKIHFHLLTHYTTSRCYRNSADKHLCSYHCELYMDFGTRKQELPVEEKNLPVIIIALCVIAHFG